MVSFRLAAGVLLSAVLLSISSSLLFSQMLPQVIYGEDDRRDLHQLTEKRWRELAKSTAVLVRRNYVKKLADEEFTYQLVTEKVGKRYDLCPSEKFWEQPSTASYCSGFLVGKDVLVSAAHCFSDAGACKTTAVVFDYAYHSSDSNPTRVAENSVYFCKEVLEHVYEIGTGLDFAVVRLDRAVQGRKPLPLSAKVEVNKGEAVTVIGHPLGLPTKMSQGKIRSVHSRGYFVINADLYIGNSGSPVFDSRTGVVKGLVARGEDDFVPRGNCDVSKNCAPDKCEGESVVLSREFADYVQRHL